MSAWRVYLVMSKWDEVDDSFVIVVRVKIEAIAKERIATRNKQSSLD